MIYMQLPTGKTVLLTLDQYLDLTDEDIQNLIADDKGRYIDNPFKKEYVPLYLKSEDQDFEIDDNIPPDEIDKIMGDN